MSSPGRSRKASTGVLGSRRPRVAESMTLTADGVSKTSFSVLVAVMMTWFSEVIRFRAESARVESPRDGDCAPTALAATAAANAHKTHNPTFMVWLQFRLRNEKGRVGRAILPANARLSCLPYGCR